MGNFLFSNWAVSLPLAAAIGMVAGVLAGLIHFISLKWNTQFYLQGEHGKALLLQLFRFGFLITVLTVLAKTGAAALLTGMACILAARSIVLRRERKAE